MNLKTSLEADKPLHIAVLLFDGFNALASQAFLDPFRSANYLKNKPLYKWTFLSDGAERVRASNGLEIANLTSLADFQEPVDMCILNASWGSEQYFTPLLSRCLHHLASKNVVLGGIDNGAFLLGYAGLLKGRSAAVHYEHIAAFRELFPDVVMGEDMYVIDRDRVTCCGGLAASDFSLEIIKQHYGTELSNAAARYIFHDRLRPGSSGQLPESQEPLGAAVPKVLRLAITHMENHLEHPQTICCVAQAAGISQRQLERIFDRYTGVSPVRYYVNVRLDRAHGLLTQTELPMLEVGIACGFSSLASFSRAYKKRFSQSPSKGRLEGRIPFEFRSFPSYAGL